MLWSPKSSSVPGKGGDNSPLLGWKIRGFHSDITSTGVKPPGTFPEGLFGRAGRTSSLLVPSEPVPARDRADIEKSHCGVENCKLVTAVALAPGVATLHRGDAEGSCPGQACRQDGCQAVPTGSCRWKRARRRAGGQGQPSAHASPTTHSAGHPREGNNHPFQQRQREGVTCRDRATVPRVPLCRVALENWGEEQPWCWQHTAQSNPRMPAVCNSASPCRESCFLSPALAPVPSGKLPPAPLPQFPQHPGTGRDAEGRGCAAMGGAQPHVPAASCNTRCKFGKRPCGMGPGGREQGFV